MTLDEAAAAYRQAVAELRDVNADFGTRGTGYSWARHEAAVRARADAIAALCQAAMEAA